MQLRLLFLALALCVIFPVHAEKPNLTLVYKDVGNPPFMEVAPDSSGLYADMLNRAAAKIGHNLTIKRLPKKRTYVQLEHGSADLYPSGQFREYRSKFLYYMPNGLKRHEVYYGLTSQKIPALTSVAQIGEHGLDWFMELGSSWPHKARSLGLKYTEIKDVSIEKAVKLIELGRPIFFQVNSELLKKYMQKNNLASMQELGVRVHTEIGVVNEAPLYTCFSRFSPHYREELNPDYDENKPLSPENFPFRPVAGSIVDKFRRALQEMIDDGEIAVLRKKYDHKE